MVDPPNRPLPASCQLLDNEYNKSMWTSEGWNLAYVNDWIGGLNLASRTPKMATIAAVAPLLGLGACSSPSKWHTAGKLALHNTLPE